MAKNASQRSSSGNGRKRSTGRRAGGRTAQRGQQPESAQSMARSRLSGVVQQADRLTRGARASARRLPSTVSSTVEDNPMIAGAALLVAGAAIGFAVRGLLRDSMWLEEQRDAIMDKARELARTAGDRVSNLTKHNRGEESSPEPH